jgi:hypothetical protein
MPAVDGVTGDRAGAVAGGVGGRLIRWIVAALPPCAIGPTERVSFDLVSHYALGLPDPDMRAGFPEAAERVRAGRERLGARALEVALQRDPTLRERAGETGLRALLRDTEVFLERIARALASGDPGQAREWADWVAPVYRRRKVPMDDLVTLSEGLRSALAAVLAPAEQAAADIALDQAIETFRRYRRIAGDARKRSRILTALYKGG